MGVAMGEQPAMTPLDLAVVDGLATIRGEIDLSTAPRVAHWLTTLPDPLHVDLRGVTFMDTAGLHALVSARRHNPTMRVVHSSPAVVRLLQISGLVDYLGGGDEGANFI